MPILALLFNALIWGLSWWPLRALDDLGVHGLWATSLAFVVATAVISIVHPRAWRGWRRHPGLFAIMVCAGLTNTAFNWGVVIGEVVRVVLLFYLMPVWSILLARVMLAEAITGTALLRIGLALAGAMIVLWTPGVGLPLPSSPGDLLGLLGGMGFALFNVLVRRERAVPAESRALASFLGGAIVPAALGLGLVAGGVVAPPPPGGLWWVGVAGFGLCLLLGNLALQYGAARLPAALAAVVMVAEVPIAALSAAWLGGEALRPTMLVGGALIVTASLLASREMRAVQGGGERAPGT